MGLKMLLKLSLVIYAFYFMFNHEFATHFEFIPRKDIFKELLQMQNFVIESSTLPPCSHGVIWNGTLIKNPEAISQTDFNDDNIENGQFYPDNCTPKYSTALIVPYRNRSEQLKVFLPYMHNFLRKQEIHYRIFVVSQAFGKPWNKGKLFNVGAKIAMALEFECIILHDVDLLPMHEANMYACTSHPRHMSSNVDKFRYNLIYKSLVGGALAITSENYKIINGFSNKYEMWGGEDDDLAARMRGEKMEIKRFPPLLSTYSMLRHAQEPVNPHSKRMLKQNKCSCKYREDGLSDIKIDSVELLYHKLYTNISVVI